MPTEASQLVGFWEKVTSSECSRIYPQRLEFNENGLYHAQNRPDSPMVIWDTGTYRMESSGLVRVSLANDSTQLYECSISENTLTFVDANNCRFMYQKIK